MKEFQEQVKKGFKACKMDIETLMNENSNLKNEIKTLKDTQTKLLSELKAIQIALNYIPSQPPTKTTPQPTKSNNTYESLLNFKAKKNKKEILKQKITQMIGEDGLDISELKYMFVDHFKYCSKASFYNYIKELELNQQIKIDRNLPKNMIFNITTQ